MWERVSVKTKPTATLITLSDLKARIRVDFDDEDSVITSYLAGAVARIDGPHGIGYAMMEQTWELSLDSFPDVIDLPGAPVKSVTSIKYYDPDNVLQTMDAADYRVDVAGDRARVEPVDSWPSIYSRFGAIVVEYLLGESDAANVPADLLDAVAIMVAHRFEMRQPAVVGTIVSSVPHSFDSIVSQYSRLSAA